MLPENGTGTLESLNLTFEVRSIYEMGHWEFRMLQETGIPKVSRPS